MPTPLDILKVGDWVAIESVNEEEVSPDLFGLPRMKTRGYPVNGKPLKILAISIPFIAVSDGSSRYSLDARECEFVLLRRKYVNAMSHRSAQTKRRQRFESEDTFVIIEPDLQLKLPTASTTKSRKKKKEDQRGLCPQCGSRLIERRKGLGTWVWACNECGFEGGNPSNT